MKKKLFLLLFIMCCCTHVLFAQQGTRIPADPDVRIGRLDNGLTYYIRKNALPENRAEFYIAQKVGSILETKDQKGLAHFLEHMCFNGTTHFPGNSLKEYLETIGVKFGVNLNAYTSIDKTVYNMSDVPIIRESIIDSCLLILHDWSNDLLLDPEEIDKERGVIHEEWRSRSNAMQRMQERALPQIFAGTQYEDCMPIGSMDIVLNFKPQVLRDYYEKWYRPDLQGIVIVGDIDVDAVEAKIKSTFADIPAQPNAAERIYYPVKDNEEPIVVIEQDKEQPMIQVMILNKHAVVPDNQKNTIDYLVYDYKKTMISSMLNARLNELLQLPEPPFVYAGTQDLNFYVTRTKDAFSGYATLKKENLEEGTYTLLREIERARRYGFTEPEYARVKASFIRQLESEYHEKDDNKNEYYTNLYVENFLEGTPILSAESQYELYSRIAEETSVESINQLFPTLVTGSNQVVLIFGPEQEGIVYPAKQEVVEMLKQIKTAELQPYVDKFSSKPLIPNLPVAGKIVEEKHNQIFGTTMLKLSNGVKVYIKPTDFKGDEIAMNGFSYGGGSLYPDKDKVNLVNINTFVSAGGLGNFSRTELSKALAGKRATALASVNDLTESISGYCSPKDIESMFQLVYLAFTSPRRDDNMFASLMSRNKASLENQELQPEIAFTDTINATVFMNHPRVFRMKAEMLDKIDYDRMLEIYKERFADASGFTFVLVGNIDIEKAKPVIAQYLGSLPSTYKKETYKDNGIFMRPGIYKNIFIREQETAKATNMIMYHGNYAYNNKNNTMINILEQILNIIYLEKVREDEGGAYVVKVSSGISKHPREEFAFQISFETSPDKRDKMIQIIFNEIRQIATTPPSKAVLNKVKEYLLKNHAEMLKENNYWLNALNQYLDKHENTVDGYEALINSITPEDISKLAHELFVEQKNEIEISMISPEKK